MGFIKSKLVIIGTSKTAIHLFKFINEYDLFDVVGFAVDKEYITENSFQELPVFTIDNLAKVIDIEKDYVFIAMLWNRLNADRRNMYERLKGQGFRFANIISPNAKVRGLLTGDNCWIHDYVIIQNDAVIGTNVMLMAYTAVGAHSILGSHTFFGAKSSIGGGCKIGAQSFIGINSTVFDDTTIGEKCIISACTAIKRNMPNYSIWKVPEDSFIIKQYSEEEIENKLLFKRNIR